MRGLEFSFGKVHHKQHICRKTEAVPELLHCNARADNHQVMRHCHTQIYESEAREGHAGGHRPEGFLEAPTGRRHTADDASDRQRKDADGSVDNADQGGVQS